MKLWRVLELAATLLIVPFYLGLGVLAWVAGFSGDSRFAWPAIALVIGCVALFIVLQTIANELHDAEMRRQYRRQRPGGGR